MLPTPAEKLQNFFGVFLQFHIGVDIFILDTPRQIHPSKVSVNTKRIARKQIFTTIKYRKYAPFI